jgi:hypothetical protein
MFMNSITDSLFTILLSHIPHKICNDGTYLLWNLSHNIHHNNVAFTKYVQDVQEEIFSTTLSQFNSDVAKYILFLKITFA